LSLNDATNITADALGKLLNLNNLMLKLSRFGEKIEAKQLSKVSSNQKLEVFTVIDPLVM